MILQIMVWAEMEKSNIMTETAQAEGKKGGFLGYKCVLKILLWENGLHYHRRKVMQGFLMVNVCLCNIKDEKQIFNIFVTAYRKPPFLYHSLN